MTKKADTGSIKWTGRKSVLLGYGMALATFAVIIGISALFSHFDFKINLAILVVVGLVAAGWYGGRGSGILLTGLVAAVTAYSTPIPPASTVTKVASNRCSVFRG